MAAQFITDSNIASLLALLRQYGEVHGPVRGDDGVVRFALLTDGMLPDLAAPRTLLPPKKYLLHPQETIMEYSAADGYQLPLAAVRPLILFGIHPCDLAGINYLDKVFLGDDPDSLYAARRSALTLVGFSCHPDHFCSCQSESSTLAAISDLFFHGETGGFAVSSGSSRGDELLAAIHSLLQQRETEDSDDTRNCFGHTVPDQTPPEPDATLPEWQEYADHCLGCGACSICCPTCCCFDVLEHGGLDVRSAVRLRNWDNCLLKNHGEVAGGSSFRGERSERFRYRYRHKYYGFGPLQGVPSCVGCGRCRTSCPSGIDLRPLAERQGEVCRGQ